MIDKPAISKVPNPRHRMIYIRQRLIELREERERLMQEMQWLRTDLGSPETKKPLGAFGTELGGDQL